MEQCKRILYNGFYLDNESKLSKLNSNRDVIEKIDKYIDWNGYRFNGKLIEGAWTDDNEHFVKGDENTVLNYIFWLNVLIRCKNIFKGRYLVEWNIETNNIDDNIYIFTIIQNDKTILEKHQGINKYGNTIIGIIELVEENNLEISVKNTSNYIIKRDMIFNDLSVKPYWYD